jgi:predicted porin
MKKTALFLAMSTAAVFAQAETVEVKLPTFYGKMNVTQDFIQQEDAGNYSELNSNASRLGLKGDFALNDEITAIYQAEYQIDVDGDDGAFSMRNTFIGAKGGFGKVQAGIFDSALKASQGKVDQFNDMKADIKNYVTNSDNRVKNVVRYQSPKMGGVVLTADHINAEAVDVNNGLSFSAVFSNDTLYGAVAHDSEVEGMGISVTRVTGQVSVDAITLGALWETEDRNGDTADGMMISAALKLENAVTLKGQFSSSDISWDKDSSTRVEGATQITLGADYKLAKNAKVFGYVSDVDTDNNGAGQVYSAGIEYKF